MAGDCEASTCPVEGGFLFYRPSLGASVFLLAAFALLVPITLVGGYRLRTPTFAWTLTAGFLLEILGFVGRVLLRGDQASTTFFALSLLGTVLGPTCFAAAIFLVLPHVMRLYGDHASSLRPRDVGVVFALLALITGGVELAGSLFASIWTSETEVIQRTSLLMAGLGLQALSLLLFVATQYWFTVGLGSGLAILHPRHASVYGSKRFRRFLMMIQIATVLLLGQSIYRIVEMAGGLGGALAQNEAAFTVVDGAVPLLVCIILTICPPGFAFGPAWGQTSQRSLDRHHHSRSPLRSPQMADAQPAHAGSRLSAKLSPMSLLSSQPSPKRSTMSSDGRSSVVPLPPSPARTHPLHPASRTRVPAAQVSQAPKRAAQPRSALVDSEALW